MDAESDDEMQSNHSDQEDDVKSVNIQSDDNEDQPYIENNTIESPNSPGEGSEVNSGSERESDAESPKRRNDDTSDNETGQRQKYEIESCDEDSVAEQRESDDEDAVNSEPDHDVAQSDEEQQEAVSDREEIDTPRSPSPSDEEVQHSDEEAQCSDEEVHRSDEEVHRSDEEVNRSDEEVHRSDEEVHQSDEEVHHSDDEVRHSDEGGVQSEDEMEQSDQENQISDAHNLDEARSSPPTPVASDEEKILGSDVENEASDAEDSDSESDKSDNESKVGELIADIFGESDEDEEFEGFGEEDLAAAKQKKEKKKATKVLSDSEGEGNAVEEDTAENASIEEANKILEPKDKVNNIEQVLPTISDEDSGDEGPRRIPEDFMYDFEIMLQRKKESQRRRKRKDIDIINDSDDLIAEIINQMRVSAEEDRQLNKNKAAATKKLKLLPMVVSQLRKHDLKEAFLDQGILSVMAEWLSPLPDRSLSHLQIRDNMLRLLAEFPPIDQGLLKSSNIGRAVMYLYKHPKETKENRERAGKLISEWARPIFNLNTNFHSMSKEEREQRDFEHMPKKRKLRLESGEGGVVKQDIERALSAEDKALRPGDKGWIARARVPMPSMKDYVVRPKWNVETDIGRGSNRKQVTRLDKHIRNFREKKKLSKVQRAVTISIEGRKMSL
ncbi:protein IWS1 homolog [Centruroides vittatus]|uniref:protein IWS1 homolog n=1 Tax=Centruroides vittatus TaxID=120091 RepID=UPI00350F2B08